MVRQVAVVLFALVLGLAGCVGPTVVPVEDGVADLSGWSPADGPVQLDGTWALAWQDLQDGTEPLPDGRIDLPGTWDGQAPDSHGVATHRVRLDFGGPAPDGLALRVRGTGATRVLVDGRDVGGVGTVALDPDGVAEDVRVQTLALPSLAPTAELAVQVANHTHRASGLRQPVLLGGASDLAARQRRNVLLDSAIVFPTLLLGAGFLGLYLLRREDGTWLWFGLFSLSMATWQTLNGPGEIALELMPGLPWLPRLRFEYVLLPMTVLTGITFVAHVTDMPRGSWWVRGVQGGAIILAVVLLVTPMRSIGIPLTATLAAMGIAFVIALGMGIRAARASRRAAGELLVAATILIAGVVFDMLTTLDVIASPVRLAAPSFLVLLVVVGLLMIRDFVSTSEQNRVLHRDLLTAHGTLQRAHEASLRFVPHAFLRLLGRETVVEIERGDHTAEEMEILFCDIRSFTGLIESLGPDRAFPFINRYLLAMEPAIVERGGFICQYLGDCIMALFPAEAGADAAVRAAIGMSEALRAFNASEPEGPIRVGIGISSGPLMVGTIGGQERLDGGVIGDPVNQASRLEGLTKHYGATLIIGQPTVARLADPDALHLRELDTVITKGKTEPMVIHEVLDALTEAERAARLATLPDWMRGLDAWREGRFDDAADAWQACVDAVPDDAVARVAVARAQQQAAAATDWDGITRLGVK